MKTNLITSSLKQNRSSILETSTPNISIAHTTPKLNKHLKSNRSQLISTASCTSPPNPDIHIPNELSNTNPSDPSNNMETSTTQSTGKSFKPSAYYLSQLLLESHEFAIINNSLHMYDSDYGYFINLSPSDFELKIRQYIPNEYKKHINSSIINEIYKWLRSDPSLVISQKALNKQIFLLNFKNIVFDLSTQNTYAHSPKYYCTNFINANYSLHPPKENYNFFKFLNQITHSSLPLQDLLQEIAGYALANIRIIKKFALLIGPSNSGKSTFLNLLEYLVGSQFCSNVSIHDLNDKFRLSLIVGKKLNTCGEMSEVNLKRLSTIKMLCGNDELIAERKGENAFKFSNTSFMLFSSNHLPSLGTKDAGDAFLKRLLIVPFPYSIPPEEQDPSLLISLYKESSFIVFWAMQGLKRLLSNKLEFSHCPEADQLYQEYVHINTSSIENFINKCCSFESNSKVITTHLYDNYKYFCSSSDETPVSQHKFTNYIKNNYPLEYKKLRIKDKTYYGFIGLSLTYSYTDTYPL